MQHLHLLRSLTMCGGADLGTLVDRTHLGEAVYFYAEPLKTISRGADLGDLVPGTGGGSRLLLRIRVVAVVVVVGIRSVVVCSAAGENAARRNFLPALRPSVFSTGGPMYCTTTRFAPWKGANTTSCRCCGPGRARACKSQCCKPMRSVGPQSF